MCGSAASELQSLCSLVGVISAGLESGFDHTLSLTLSLSLSPSLSHTPSLSLALSLSLSHPLSLSLSHITRDQVSGCWWYFVRRDSAVLQTQHVCRCSANLRHHLLRCTFPLLPRTPLPPSPLTEHSSPIPPSRLQQPCGPCSSPQEPLLHLHLHRQHFWWVCLLPTSPAGELQLEYMLHCTLSAACIYM